jgi:exodeoxyribonuclease VII large subunit
VVSNRVEQDTRFIDESRRRIRSTITNRVQHGLVEIDQLSARVRALSPAATLDRGYAVVQHAGSVVRDPQEVPMLGELRIRVARGELTATRTKDES